MEYLKYNYKKMFGSVMTALLFLTLVIPVQTAWASITTLGDNPAAWPAVFTPYTDSNGNYIFDPAGEPGISPIEVDVASGVDEGTGNLPSMYVASDSTNFFVRLRLKGNPYDSKGGFLSSVWEVQLAVNGVKQATIGVDGKSPSVDYVYIANANGTNAQPIYMTTTPGGNTVPGTRITPAENGQYFLDFQVPISRITQMAPAITASTPVQLYFGTSKAANLSVINKDGMDLAPGVSGAATQLNAVAPTVVINGGASKQYGSATSATTMTGKSSLSSGTVTVTIDGTPYTA
ncbi:hypothetical protein, partial [Gordoniibacillus kamchatkensis]|uniref:hypothetical protein n=1 Tax=Gordoniibacillus kamchatkensis TaxID=1590651 RepID=UPI0012E053D0